jgi:hypothetical protein
MSTPPVIPGVVLKTKFVTSDKKTFQDYMDNPDKTSSLFTQQSNQLNDEEKKQLKKLFEKAQKNNSIMWQDVITFHNPWLQENGLYDASTHTVDEKKLIRK